MLRKREDHPGYKLWLKYNPLRDSLRTEYWKQIGNFRLLGDSPVHGALKREASLAFEGMFGTSIPGERGKGCALIIALDRDWKQMEPSLFNPEESENPGEEGFRLVSLHSGDLSLSSPGSSGLLYGFFHLLRMMRLGQPLKGLNLCQSPRLQYRMLNHWDNLDGSVERGYAGLTLWKWSDLPEKVDPRYTDYARACASVGINAASVNNVNTQPEILSDPYLEKAAVLAAVFREYGIKLFLSVNFASPQLLGGLESSDPMDQKVIDWWTERVAAIYRRIPDFGGFVVKADSEGQPGPFAYGRTHSDGANMLGRLLEPFGGLLVWRAFVYGHGEKDRVTTSYEHFKPQDGEYHSNVALQVKNGAVDFQPREPVHPLFGAMEKTNLFMEIQITQEYLGQGNQLVYLGPMWKEILDFDTRKEEEPRCIGPWLADRGTRKITGIAAVANTGDDPDWCGSLMHPMNWYAFGRLSWDYHLDAEDIIREWIISTFDLEGQALDWVTEMLMLSWEACVDYTSPLCLHHIMKEGHHYGPDPGYNSGLREDWRSTYYHRADSKGIGFDRTRKGSNGVDQYEAAVAEEFNDPKSCPEKYILWFHHLPWDQILSSGRTVKDEISHQYSRGVQKVEQMIALWDRMENQIDHETFELVRNKLKIQLFDAKEWKKVCTEYFLSFTHP